MLASVLYFLIFAVILAGCVLGLVRVWRRRRHRSTAASLAAASWLLVVGALVGPGVLWPVLRGPSGDDAPAAWVMLALFALAGLGAISARLLRWGQRRQDDKRRRAFGQEARRRLAPVWTVVAGWAVGSLALLLATLYGAAWIVSWRVADLPLPQQSAAVEAMTDVLLPVTMGAGLAALLGAGLHAVLQGRRLRREDVRLREADRAWVEREADGGGTSP